jgi:hypothetical protein
MGGHGKCETARIAREKGMRPPSRPLRGKTPCSRGYRNFAERCVR